MPELVQMLSLSTGHLPPAVRDDLDAIAAPGADFPTDDWRSRILATNWFGYGWILHVPEDQEQDVAFPSALDDCLAFARAQRVGFVKFHCDVEPIADLAFHDDGDPADPAS